MKHKVTRGFSEGDSAAEKTVYHCVSADFCQILTPKNLQDKGTCITVCITVADSRGAKFIPGMCPGGILLRVCATRPSVNQRVGGRRPGDISVSRKGLRFLGIVDLKKITNILP